LSLIVEENETQSVICLEGATGIAEAARLKELLLQALKSKKEVSVSLRRATDLDVTAVQLLWASEREARSSGVTFRLAEPIPQEVSVALCDAGFEKFPVSEN
jgi:anti-anti-sigma regulatory factor